MKKFENIVEKKLGISPDYQYVALNNSNFLQRNWHRNKLTVIQKLNEFTKSKRVLNLGPGSGNLELSFAKKVKEIIAVDYHNEALIFLNSKLKENKITNTKLINDDIRSIEVADYGKFDIIFMIDVIEHIKIKDALKLVRKFKQMTKKGGSVCIITPNYNSPWIFIEKMLDRLTIVPHFDGEQHLAKYHPKSLRLLFERNGFKTENISTFNLFSYIFPLNFLSSLLCKIEITSGFKYGNLVVGTFKNE